MSKYQEKSTFKKEKENDKLFLEVIFIQTIHTHEFV